MIMKGGSHLVSNSKSDNIFKNQEVSHTPAFNNQVREECFTVKRAQVKKIWVQTDSAKEISVPARANACLAE